MWEVASPSETRAPMRWSDAIFLEMRILVREMK
jgi:hypothetical protein